MTTALVCLGIWTVIAAAGCLAMHRARCASTPTPEPEVVNWLPLLPPVPLPTTPPFTQTVPSADWFYDVPADCLSDDAIRVLSDDIDANFRVIGGAA